MANYLLLAILALCFVHNECQSTQTIYLPPLTNDTSLPQKLIVFVPGGLVPLENYIPTSKAIQRNTKTRLWVSIVYCLGYLCDPVIDLNTRILNAIDGTKQLGFTPSSNSDIIIVGHSLGGVGARHFIDSYSTAGYGGLGLFGTQYNGDSENFRGTLGYPVNLRDWKIPLLAITGELDMVPTSHLALLQQQSWQLPTSQQYRKFGYVIPGMDHSAFCPGFYVKNDIKQEIQESDALNSIGKISGAWLDVISFSSPPSSAYSILSAYNSTTTPLITPFLIARQVESGGWCSSAQLTLSGLPQSQYKLLDVSVQTVYDSLNLTGSHTTYSLSQHTLHVQVVNYAPTDSGFKPDYAGALEIACKAISADRVAQQLNVNVTPSLTCADVNKLSLSYAKSLLNKYWPSAINRFNEQGIPFSFGADEPASIGPLWVVEGLSWSTKASGKSKVLNVASPSLQTSVSSPIYPGNHYCKLMSPARALEWIMTMGLTHRY